MEEELKKLIGSFVFQIAKLQADLQAAAVKNSALQKENEELKKAAEPKKDGKKS